MKTQNPKIAQIIADCAKKAKSKAKKCMYPNCEEVAINSHIMQKNGILSSISENHHLWELIIDNYKENYIKFKETGIKKIYTFKGFCNPHDSSLFDKIETKGEIDFNDYESCLLFALRTLYNEVWKKKVTIETDECILNTPNIDINTKFLREVICQKKLGLKDADFYTQAMWKDLKNKSESFVFEHREMEMQEICLNSIFTYDTSQEIMDYKKKHGKDMERTSDIFISYFPYNNKSILLMGYHKEDSLKVQSFVNMFFKENISKTNRRLSSLIVFNCETWVCSNKFYKDKLEGLDSEFFKAMLLSTQNGDERKNFDINLFRQDFKLAFKHLIDNKLVN